MKTYCVVIVVFFGGGVIKIKKQDLKSKSTTIQYLSMKKDNKWALFCSFKVFYFILTTHFYCYSAHTLMHINSKKKKLPSALNLISFLVVFNYNYTV